MSKRDDNRTEAAMRLRQAGQIFYRVLDGLGRLGIVPWELLPLAVFCADFVLSLATVFWIGARKTRAVVAGSVRALSQRPAAAAG